MKNSLTLVDGLAYSYTIPVVGFIKYLDVGSMAKKVLKRGEYRPRGSERRTLRTIRAASDEWGAWKKFARKKGLSCSEWVRQACRRQIQIQEIERRRAVRRK